MVEPKSDKVWYDQTITYSEHGEQYQAKPADILVAAARMQRDGRSLKSIMVELDIVGLVSNFQLQRAITNVGMPELERRIKSGEVEAETKILVDRYSRPLSPSDSEDD